MKILNLVLLLLVGAPACNAQNFSVKDPAFEKAFTKIYKSADNEFEEVKGKPIVANILFGNDTVGYVLTEKLPGVSEWDNIGHGYDTYDISFKLGELSLDSSEVAKRFDDLISLIKKIDPNAFFEEDQSYSDTKVKQMRVCSGKGLQSCGEDEWKTELYFYFLTSSKGKKYNITVNMQSFLKTTD